ncbi:MAG: YjjG family noncanonical pyrimidine nucleotidase [Sphaerochaetaceae bacterium]|nr:YjjG family noncanonical pyrimidine nucleotidase [Sphaerochaetaceae bacterium]
MKYKYLLFDADNTLLDFDENERVSIIKTFKHVGIPCDECTLSMYHEININYWNMLAEKKITKEELLYKRFDTLFEQVGIKADSKEVEKYYRVQLGLGFQVIDGALDIYSKLKDRYKLYIITNGVAKTQHARLEASGFESMSDGIFISDEIGYDKPDVRFFEYVASKIEGFDRKEALVIGDSLSSDIQGGINFGIDTCWVNIYKKANLTAIKPNYEITNIKELEKLLP